MECYQENSEAKERFFRGGLREARPLLIYGTGIGGEDMSIFKGAAVAIVTSFTENREIN